MNIIAILKIIWALVGCVFGILLISSMIIGFVNAFVLNKIKEKEKIKELEHLLKLLIEIEMLEETEKNQEKKEEN